MDSATPMRAKRLLVVDDEPLIRDLVREVAEMLGWQVAQAAGGLDLIKRDDIADMDVILTDMAMPDMGGGEIVRWLTKQKLRACVSSCRDTSPAMSSTHRPLQIKPGFACASRCTSHFPSTSCPRR